MLQQKEIAMDKLNEAISFGDIFNEGLGDAIKAGVQAAGANIKATHQVNKQNKEADKKAALQNAQGNLNAVNSVIEKLQPIANEQKTFDADTINSLMKSINELSVDDKIKKQVNQLLNQQTQVLNAAAQQEKPEDAKAENPQGDNNAANGGAAPAEQPAQPEQKGNAANIQQGDANVIDAYLDSAAQKLGKSKDDIIAFLKTK